MFLAPPTQETALFLFHHTLQRMLMIPRKRHHLCHFGFGDFVRVNAAFSDTVMVDVQHDQGRVLFRAVEEMHDHVNDKLHRRVIIVEQKHPEQIRPLRLGSRSRGNCRAIARPRAVFPGRAEAGGP